MRRTKIVAAMLSLVFVFMLFPSLRVSAASTGECGTDLTYTLDDAGNLTISGTGNKIDPGAFSYNTSIKTVTMPDSVTSIDIGAFRECTSLETIEMPGVTLLVHHAFYGCTSLKTIEMPKATSIGEFAFWGCISLETIEMPEVTSIGGQRTFYGCTNLKTIEMPKATSIGEWAFAGCTSLETIEMPEVTSIGEWAFAGCTSLETIEMPKVTSIGERAFENCTSLKTIEMPEVTSIGERAFSGCTSLKTIEMPEVTSIGDYAFRECTSLETIEMPEVTSIGDYVFLDCTSLTTVTMNSSLAEKCKNYDVFQDCPSNLKINYSNITYSSGGNGTVTGYVPGSDPTTVYLTLTPDTGYIVNTVTVTDSTGTATINPDSSGNYSFPLPSGDATVDATFIKGGTFGAQGNNLTWTLDDAGTLTISGTGDMADYDWSGNYSPFYQNTDIKNVIICSGITSIGDHAFEDCKSLTGITIPDSVTSIGDSAFYCCTSLTSITIPDSVTSIGDSAFMGCTSLTGITIPDSVTSIGDDAFGNCTNLTSITIPDSVTSIGDFAFVDCTNLTGITIPDSVTSIGDCAFNFCTSLTSITIPDSVTSIGDNAFSYCTSLKSVTIGSGVTSISGWAFDNCTSLESITIPDSVQDIGVYAFRSCTSLTDVTMSKVLYNKLVQNNKLGDVFYGITLPSIHVRYTVDYKSNGNGTISGTTTKSFGTDQIELTIQPDSNYELDKIEWSDGTNSGVLTETSGKYTMPDTEAGAVTLTATFKLDQKTVTFKNEDGTVLQSGAVDCGTNPAYTGTTPAKAEDDKYTYTFAGWSDGTNTYGPTNTLPAVTDDVTYTATFTETAKPTPEPTTPTPAPTTPAPTTPAPTVPVTKPGTYYLSSMVEKDGNIVITIKMSEDDTKTFDLLGTVTSDGVALTEGNQYTAAKGSAIITINKSFLDTLAAGTHKLTVTFTDGGSIAIDYEVKAPAQAAPQAAAQAVQATGEAVSAASIAGACLILTAAGIAFTVTRKRKEEA